MWPDHCIQGSHGAKFHKDLEIDGTEVCISKGIKQDVDSHSGFGSYHENTGLYDLLIKNSIEKVYIVGLAFDLGAGYTAEDAAFEGFETYVIKDVTKSVDIDDERFMIQRMKKAGVNIINFADLSKYHWDDSLILRNYKGISRFDLISFDQEWFY